MKSKVILLFLSLVGVITHAQKLSDIKDDFQRHSIAVDNGTIIIGVSRNDCKLHTVELGRIFEHLKNKRVNNVIFLTDAINDFHQAMYTKFGIEPNTAIPVVIDQGIFDKFYKIPLSFFAYVEKDNVQKDQLGAFFTHVKDIQEKYHIGVSSVVDITYQEDFQAWQTSYTPYHALLFDYPMQHVAVIDLSTGKLIGSMLSRAIQLPDSVKKVLAQTPENYALSEQMRVSNQYLRMGLTETSINGLEYDESRDKILLYLEYGYFTIERKDTNLYRVPIVAVADEYLHITSFIFLDFETEVAKGHYANMLLRTRKMTDANLFTYNMKRVGLKGDWMGFAALPREGNTVNDQQKKLYPLSKSISSKALHGTTDLTVQFGDNDSKIYGYHVHFPIIYHFENGTIRETHLNVPQFPKGKPMSITPTYFGFDTKLLQNGYFLSHYLNRETMTYTIGYYTKDGAEVGIYTLKNDMPVVDFEGNEEDVLGYMWTTVGSRKEGKSYAVKIVVW